jgi:hypothetical protein
LGFPTERSAAKHTIGSIAGQGFRLLSYGKERNYHNNACTILSLIKMKSVDKFLPYSQENNRSKALIQPIGYKML